MRTGFGAVPLYTPLYAGFCSASIMRLTRSSLHEGHRLDCCQPCAAMGTSTKV